MTSSGTGAESARLVVGDVLTRAETNGERIVSLGRLIFALAILVVWPVATWTGLRSGQIANASVLVLAAAAAATSIVILLRLRTKAGSSTLRALSTGIDALFALLLLAAF